MLRVWRGGPSGVTIALGGAPPRALTTPGRTCMLRVWRPEAPSSRVIARRGAPPPGLTTPGRACMLRVWPQRRRDHAQGEHPLRRRPPAVRACMLHERKALARRRPQRRHDRARGSTPSGADHAWEDVHAPRLARRPQRSRRHDRARGSTPSGADHAWEDVHAPRLAPLSTPLRSTMRNPAAQQTRLEQSFRNGGAVAPHRNRSRFRHIKQRCTAGVTRIWVGRRFQVPGR
jgi:hypothetical protein